MPAYRIFIERTFVEVMYRDIEADNLDEAIREATSELFGTGWIRYNEPMIVDDAFIPEMCRSLDE